MAPPRSPRRGLARALALTLALLVPAACRRPAPAARIPIAVRVQAVGRTQGAAAIRYAASIHPATTVELAFRVGGYIESIAEIAAVDGRPRLLQEGDTVRRGDVLVAVRRADYRHKLREALAARAEAVAAQQQAQVDYGRAQRLVRSHSIPQAELDLARARREGAVARVAGASVRVEEARTALGDATLRAPMDGVVLARHVELGTLVAPGTPAVTLADVGTVRAVFGVPDPVVQTLRLGTAQPVLPESGRAGRDGTITRISPSADPKSRAFEVEVTIPNADRALRPGMVVTLPLSSAQAQAAPVAVLPLAAVVRAPAESGHEFAVFVLEAGPGGPVARLRPVELGGFLGNDIPIYGGVADAEQVVVSGAPLLRDGEPVAVIPPGDDP